MDLEFWHQRWIENQIGFHQPDINAHLQEYWGKLGLPPDAPVFVPLCGKSRDMLWLRAQGHPVLGVEISPIAVQDFFSENGLSPQISQEGTFERWDCDQLNMLCGDFFHLTSAQLSGIAGVYDRASLIALPPPMRQSYAQHLSAIIPDNAGCLLVTLEYDQSEMEGPPFSVHRPEIEMLFAEHFRIEQLYFIDILEENPQFRKKGLTALGERVYRLLP